ncbi:MAG TPA: hypothetical protein VF246_00370 [Acidimicrobiia bacterium]
MGRLVVVVATVLDVVLLLVLEELEEVDGEVDGVVEAATVVPEAWVDGASSPPPALITAATTRIPAPTQPMRRFVQRPGMSITTRRIGR